MLSGKLGKIKKGAMSAMVGSFCFFATATSAQNIRPECTKMRNKRGCTCALNNGAEYRQTEKDGFLSGDAAQ